MDTIGTSANPSADGSRHPGKSDGHQYADFDYVDLYVGNTHQAAHYYRTAFGFEPLAYSGLETGERDRASLVMQQGKVRLVLTSALSPDSPVAEHVRVHGDGVKDIAFTVANAASAFEEAVRRGARPIMAPTVLEDETGRVVKATIGSFGEIVHSLIQRDGYEGPFLPPYQPVKSSPPVTRIGVERLDHVALSVEAGTLNEWIEFYINVLGFVETHEENISTEYSAMNSKVVQSSNGNIKFPTVEPAPGKRKSQVQEYLEFHHGPGAQHAAFLSPDITQTVQALRQNGVEFLRVPDCYYEVLEERVGKLEEEDLATLSKLNILVDRDPKGYLMQTFTKPVQSRPTFFLEVIQRKGAVGFGGGNIKALFEAVEREQALRGNL